MSLESSIILGVVSGILTATIIFLIKEFWVKTLIPWYQGFSYQGADISGSWFAEYTDETTKGKSTYSVTLKQNAHMITGSMHFSYVSEERKFNIDYKLSGEYWEGYLNIMCRSKDRKVYSHGSIFLKLINGGTGLLGEFCFRNVQEDTVNHFPLGLDRN